MRKAIIITAHQKPEQLNIFIRQLLNDKDTDIYVHINKKCDAMKSKVMKDPRVFISNNNIEISWGADSLLRAQLIMLEEVLRSADYEYILIQTGQDLQIRDGLDAFLSENKDKIFLDDREDDLDQRIRMLTKWPKCMLTLRDKRYDPIKILRRFRLELARHGVPLIRKRVDFDVKSIRFHKSFSWLGFPTYVARYILDYLKEHPDYWTIYANSMVTEEVFWATTIAYSPYAGNLYRQDGIAKNLMYTAKFVNSHPPVITYNDIDELEQSGAFFARKFDIDADKKVIDYFYHKITSG